MINKVSRVFLNSLVEMKLARLVLYREIGSFLRLGLGVGAMGVKRRLFGGGAFREGFIGVGSRKGM